MINFLKNWKEQTIFIKIITIAGIIIDVAILVLCVLSLTGIMENADNIFMPLLGVLMLIQAVQNWKIHKRLSIFSILVTIFIFVVVILKFMRI